jgi:two-component system, OmpR family, response regulator
LGAASQRGHVSFRGFDVHSAFPRVLAVDDEDDIRELLIFGLTRAGFEVRTAEDGYRALDLVREWAPELIVLDVMLPGVDGFSMLPAFRRITEVPIIMLSVRNQIPDKVYALGAGADDYLSKPFDLQELVARLRAALRRPRLEMHEVVTYSDLKIDVARRFVTRGTRRIDLSNREFDLLLMLARNAERVFTRAELLDLVWGVDRDVGPSTVETYISYLRSKIDLEGSPHLIATRRGLGYALFVSQP